VTGDAGIARLPGKGRLGVVPRAELELPSPTPSTITWSRPIEGIWIVPTGRPVAGPEAVGAVLGAPTEWTWVDQCCASGGSDASNWLRSAA